MLLKRSEALEYTLEVHRPQGTSVAISNVSGEESPRCVNYLTFKNRRRWQPRTRGAIDTARWHMQMHQIRYFLALCEERNFTRAAKRCGVSQPSLTNAIIGLEQELGGALFQRKPLIALTVLGHAVHPYLTRIAQEADHAREAAQAMAAVRPGNSEAAPIEQLARSPACPSS
jgi:hypothetical protein